MTKKEAFDKIEQLKDGEHCYFNMPQGGGALCHRCNGMYLLFKIPLYGGEEQYFGTYYEHEFNDLIGVAFSWT